jgi:hypothetical protein
VRLSFIDNIRWVMIVLVLSMHSADTYSPFGNWYYSDRGAVGLPTVVFFGFYQSFLQAFFMALLFLSRVTSVRVRSTRRGRRDFCGIGSSGSEFRRCCICC